MYIGQQPKKLNFICLQGQYCNWDDDVGGFLAHTRQLERRGIPALVRLPSLVQSVETISFYKTVGRKKKKKWAPLQSFAIGKMKSCRPIVGKNDCRDPDPQRQLISPLWSLSCHFPVSTNVFFPPPPKQRFCGEVCWRLGAWGRLWFLPLSLRIHLLGVCSVLALLSMYKTNPRHTLSLSCLISQKVLSFFVLSG